MKLESIETAQPGWVHLVGAGPGDPGLVTRRAAALIARADVVAYDRLVHPDVIGLASPSAELIPVGKGPTGPSTPQTTINATLVRHARRGAVVVRLKGGDPFVFGRGREEADYLAAHGVPYEIVPGVSSAVAAPAAAGIPVTDRRCASAFAVVTGHQCDEGSDLAWHALAQMPTLVVLMGTKRLALVTARLVACGVARDRPAALVAQATWPGEQTVTGTVGTIADLAGQHGIRAPATLIVGEVVRYADARSTPDVVRQDDAALVPVTTSNRDLA